MVLGNLPVPGRLTIWMIVRRGPVIPKISWKVLKILAHKLVIGIVLISTWSLSVQEVKCKLLTSDSGLS